MDGDGTIGLIRTMDGKIGLVRAIDSELRTHFEFSYAFHTKS